MLLTPPETPPDLTAVNTHLYERLKDSNKKDVELEATYALLNAHIEHLLYTKIETETEKRLKPNAQDIWV